MTIEQYVERLNTRYKTGISREHSYRGDLQNLLETLCTDVLVTNEPARIACGAPDYILTRKNIPIGYIEAKDVGEDLVHKKHKEQFERYRASLANLIITDYLDFRFYRDGEFITSVQIASIQGSQIVGEPKHYSEFDGLIKDFSTHEGQTIKSAKKLAEMMAGKARMLANVIENALWVDEEESNNQVHESANNTLREQLEAFRNILIHDIKAKEFADIYAQTIAYGMFAARLHDPSLDNFSRQEAAELIPKSNPFLRKLFQYIAGYDLDDRIKWIVDALADIFSATDVAALLQNFGKATQQHDPIIHFYETFLGEYDPKLRKARGVWYTPEPVVNFIVRAVDDILKTEFGLKEGLADTSKTRIKVKVPTADRRSKTGYTEAEQEVHKVQILDPATGTGTFLAEVVKHIHKKFEGQQGIWSQYVENHLLPRLNGFEILMASYAMAHLKLDLLLTETGYKPKKEQRFRVYLTNSLEEHHPDTGTLFANWLSSEANEANHIKRDTPVMVVLGNPPYSVSSTNKGAWIEGLMQDYKKNLKEKNMNPLSDDYLKFIRYGQHFIDKNGEGVLAYISNNSFLDGLIHRQMRKSVIETFDKIYVLDLHGNVKKQEVNLDGSKDENVFDIMQGVSINIFVKLSKSNKLAAVFKNELYGSRTNKYSKLNNSDLREIKWEQIAPVEPYYFFVKKDFSESKAYNKFLSINDLFHLNKVGFATEFDSFTIKNNQEQAEILNQTLKERSVDDIMRIYGIDNNKKEKVISAIADIKSNKVVVTPIDYRPFDTRYTLYSGKANGFMGRPRSQISDHLVARENIALISCRQQSTFDFQHSFVSKFASDGNSISLQTKERTYVFPLYSYVDNKTQLGLSKINRTPNLNPKIVEAIVKKLGLSFTAEKLDAAGNVSFANSAEVRPEFRTTFAPIDLLDYIYAVLHSPSYREKYKEFLKIDFPRVPYPKDTNTFWALVALGGELRQIHLLESEQVQQYITTYPADGNNIITRKITTKSPGFELNDPKANTGKVWINDEQYFDGVPQLAWEFYIGGYQPAQKWLKDRQGRQLSFEDILHYQKIIVALSETDRIMKKIDQVKLN